MNIFFDHQTFSLQTFGGISRYYAELIAGINQTTDNKAYLPLLFSDNIHLQEVGIKPKNYTPNWGFYKKLQIIYRSNQAYTVSQLRQKPFDIFHATYYDPYFLPHLSNKPIVVTLHDTIHEKFSAQFSELADDKLIVKRKKLLADRADCIIAVSENTKKDVVNLLGISPDKITVIYLGSSLKLNSDAFKTAKVRPEQPYMLFVGNRRHYKNFKRLIEALIPLFNLYNLRLVCAGGGDFTKEEILFLQQTGVKESVLYRSINDTTLISLYKNAEALVVSSLYEGFGITVLEAFSCECPCILSNSGSLPEIAGDAALYFDPTDSESIMSSIVRFLDDTVLRKSLVSKGKERLKLFSWQRMVDETLNLYQNFS